MRIDFFREIGYCYMTPASKGREYRLFRFV
jgi:hypothetical protein